MRSTRVGNVAVLFAACAACKGAAAPAETAPAAAPGIIRVESRPPTSKDVVDAAMKSAGVPLNVHETCRNVGTEPTDATLGRYLSGFIAELDPESGKNGIVTSVSQTDVGWLCRLMVQHRAGDDVWSWGLEFEIGKDGVLNPTSYRCIGGG